MLIQYIYTHTPILLAFPYVWVCVYTIHYILYKRNLDFRSPHSLTEIRTCWHQSHLSNAHGPEWMMTEEAWTVAACCGLTATLDAGMQIQKTYTRKSTGKMLKVLFLDILGIFSDDFWWLRCRHFSNVGIVHRGRQVFQRLHLEVHFPGARRQFRSMNIEALGSGTWWIVWWHSSPKLNKSSKDQSGWKGTEIAFVCFCHVRAQIALYCLIGALTLTAHSGCCHFKLAWDSLCFWIFRVWSTTVSTT